MGHGPVDIVKYVYFIEFIRSVTAANPAPIHDYNVLFHLAMTLCDSVTTQPEDVRGIGLSLHNLTTHVFPSFLLDV